VGEATLTLRRYLHRFGCCLTGPVIAHAVAPAAAGTHWYEIPVPRQLRGAVRAQVQMLAGDAIASDTVPLRLGAVLPIGLVRDTMDGLTRDMGDAFLKYRCRRMSNSRIDCWTRLPGSHRCRSMRAFTAGRDGIVRRRDYSCKRGRPRFARHPRWSGQAVVIAPLG
jgi:hypothetical protein